MKLRINIHKIKCIEDLVIDLPIDRGLYAITGQNGSGKSTIAACASSVFFNLPMNDYFGITDEDARISFDLEGAQRSWYKKDGKWYKHSEGQMNIKGFFEGSLIYGNRFKDMSFDNIRELDSIKQDKLFQASDFIRKNMGLILQGDPDYYEKLWMVSSHYERFKGDIFFYEKGGKRISQFHMSTGENLLVSILNSLYIRNNDRASLSKPCVLFLDEIELALHPSSLKRLIQFLEDMSRDYNYAVYFSTHSIEMISGISPQNIFFVQRHADNTIEVINPCYPAYATRILYDHTGYDNVILVEDDLAKTIVDRILRKEHLLGQRLIHVLPCGGWKNTIELANDVVRFNLLGKLASICVILDGDVKEEVTNYLNNKKVVNNIPISFLPVQSLEKYLRDALVLNVDHALFRRLNDYVFQQRSLDDLIVEYQQRDKWEMDKSGKVFFSILNEELIKRRIERGQLIEVIVDYLFEGENGSVKEISAFLSKQLA